ncbi:hypothetical protein CBL16_12680 [Enterococcus faecalis]|nr:hypothetical protein CBL16_12680 [Enterococcus faecalis]
MFLFDYGNFMKKETNSAKKQWTFFSFCLIKNSLFLYIQHKNNKKIQCYLVRTIIYFTCYKITRKILYLILLISVINCKRFQKMLFFKCKEDMQINWLKIFSVDKNR